MALNDPPEKTLTATEAVDVTPEAVAGEDEEEEVGDEELKKLEMEAEEMAKRILEYRATLPDQLKTALASILSSRRPNVPDFGSDLDSGIVRESTAGEDGTSSQSVLPAIQDPKNAERLLQLKDRISSNIAAMPLVIDRVKECISKFDNLDSHNGVVHPAFLKKKPS